MIKKMCDVMLGDMSGGGDTCKRILYKGRERIVHTGKRGGKYVMYKKNTPKRGGATPKQYKGISIFSDMFVNFLSTTLFARVKSLTHETLETITMIYDEMDELGVARANDYIVILYDFMDLGDRNIFYLKTDLALAACYAFDVVAKDPVRGVASLLPNELECYREFRQILGLPTIPVVA
jgi:hypothetical protein